ncbi:MAG: zinc ribbon domain-containing protein, partial [Candidatus Brocadia sp.]
MNFVYMLILFIMVTASQYTILLAEMVNNEAQNPLPKIESSLKTKKNVLKNKLCPECNRIYPGDVNFCSVDGKELAEFTEEYLICPTCKEKANPGEKFCRKDGTPLINISSPEEKTTNESHTGATLEELANKA